MTALPLPPQAPAEELARLAMHPEIAVRAAVAAHPNTPPAALQALAADFPGEVLGNPGLPLLRLADPRFVLDWPHATLLGLVRHPLAPAWLRRHAWAQSHSDFAVALAHNPGLNDDELRRLAAHRAWQVRARIASRPTLPPELLELLAGDPDYGVRMYVAARTDLPGDLNETLGQDASAFVRQVREQARRTGT